MMVQRVDFLLHLKTLWSMLIVVRSFGRLVVNMRRSSSSTISSIANDVPFPNEDDHQHGVMCGLAALHMAAALGRWRIILNDGMNLEFMFCRNCGYFTNNCSVLMPHVIS